MDKDNVICLKNRDFSRDAISELVRNGARRLLAQALKQEVEEFVSQYDGQFAKNGHRAVVRSGYQRARDIQTGRLPRPSVGVGVGADEVLKLKSKQIVLFMF